MFVIGILGLVGFLVFAVLLIMSAIKKNGKTKKNLVALAVSFIVFIVGVATGSQPETDKQAKKDPVQSETKNKSVAKSNNKDEANYSKEQENNLIKTYNKIIDDSDGLITKIQQEDSYNIINVTLDDAFKSLNKTKKQELINDWGNKIENNTRAQLFATGIKDFKYVYFKDTKGNHLAKTGHLDRNWKVK